MKGERGREGGKEGCARFFSILTHSREEEGPCLQESSAAVWGLKQWGVLQQEGSMIFAGGLGWLPGTHIQYEYINTACVIYTE